MSLVGNETSFDDSEIQITPEFHELSRYDALLTCPKHRKLASERRDPPPPASWQGRSSLVLEDLSNEFEQTHLNEEQHILRLKAQLVIQAKRLTELGKRIANLQHDQAEFTTNGGLINTVKSDVFDETLHEQGLFRIRKALLRLFELEDRILVDEIGIQHYDMEVRAIVQVVQELESLQVIEIPNKTKSQLSLLTRMKKAQAQHMFRVQEGRANGPHTTSSPLPNIPKTKRTTEAPQTPVTEKCLVDNIDSTVNTGPSSKFEQKFTAAANKLKQLALMRMKKKTNRNESTQLSHTPKNDLNEVIGNARKETEDHSSGELQTHSTEKTSIILKSSNASIEYTHDGRPAESFNPFDSDSSTSEDARKEGVECIDWVKFDEQTGRIEL